MAPLLPALAANARTLLARAAGSTNDLAARAPAATAQLGPLAARTLLKPRETDADGNPIGDTDPHRGAVNPHDINNKGIFALFALIGVAFVLGGIWFFFWAKNGGFYFKEDDWDDYKSTVLRRRGPNGTILSNATKSTKLGGGSIYKDFDENTEYTGAQTHTQLSGETGSTLSGITAGASDLAAREKRARKKERHEREKEKRKDRKSRHGRKVGEDGALVDEEAENEARDAIRQYRNERAARVGGINKESEGSQWDGSTIPSSSVVGSDLQSKSDTTERRASRRAERSASKAGRAERSASRAGRAERSSSRVERSASRAERAERSASKAGRAERSASRAARGERSTEKPAEKNAERKAGGIRKVYSTADRREARENDRIRAETRKQLKGRNPSRKDYNYQRADSYQRPVPLLEGSEVGGSYLSASQETDASSDLGTKSYHHVIPGLSSVAGSGAGPSDTGDTDIVDYAEEKRKRRGNGYHRANGDEV